jgi:hypothetical protein
MLHLNLIFDFCRLIVVSCPPFVLSCDFRCHWSLRVVVGPYAEPMLSPATALPMRCHYHRRCAASPLPPTLPHRCPTAAPPLLPTLPHRCPAAAAAATAAAPPLPCRCQCRRRSRCQCRHRSAGHTVILFCWQFVLLFVLRSLAFFCQAEH